MESLKQVRNAAKRIMSLRTRIAKFVADPQSYYGTFPSVNELAENVLSWIEKDFTFFALLNVHVRTFEEAKDNYIQHEIAQIRRSFSALPEVTDNKTDTYKQFEGAIAKMPEVIAEAIDEAAQVAIHFDPKGVKAAKALTADELDEATAELAE